MFTRSIANAEIECRTANCSRRVRVLKHISYFGFLQKVRNLPKKKHIKKVKVPGDPEQILQEIQNLKRLPQQHAEPLSYR